MKLKITFEVETEDAAAARKWVTTVSPFAHRADSGSITDWYYEFEENEDSDAH